MASLIDVTATFMDYAEAGTLEYQDGRSLRPLLESATEHHRDYSRSALTNRDGPWRFVQDQRYKLVEGFGSEPQQLFDREADPFEDENIAQAKPAEVERLSRLFVDA